MIERRSKSEKIEGEQRKRNEEGVRKKKRWPNRSLKCCLVALFLRLKNRAEQRHCTECKKGGKKKEKRRKWCVGKIERKAKGRKQRKKNRGEEAGEEKTKQRERGVFGILEPLFHSSKAEAN